MRRIAFINEKGGTCKTTLAVNVAAWLASARGARVLLCDLDTQGHAGKSLGIDVRTLSPTIADLLCDPKVHVNQVVRPTPVAGLDLLPSNKSLARFPLEVAGRIDRERCLLEKLSDLAGYDFVIFDGPPSMGLVTQNILLAAEEVVVPVGMTYFALDGCAEVKETVETVRRESGHASLRISLVVPVLYRKTALADAILAKLRDHFPDELCKTVLGWNVQIDEAQSHGKTIWEHAPSSKGAQLLEAIAREVAIRGAAKTARLEQAS
ncbi:ParA family protein [Vulgatibacter incomptus]|uniref:Chromosome (Plasmid) partitioning protein ParA n=1 Tax=Vulgatibacter incomptus TaxID=1391653 RepID=A0A0K1P9F6_9BACT|nr:ParA family protein [Vulgatibacter incomptus]AKU90173.1 Chromosome (plasmid) partitioning protein ParA [Vulgatibacter incomptus]